MKRGDKVNNFNVYDKNIYLINLYNCIKKNPERLFNEIMKLVNIFNDITEFKGNKKPKSLEEGLKSQESYYYWIRNEFNKEIIDIYIHSAMFIFINKTCFRGIYRTGPKGYNVPFGHNKNPKIIDKKHLFDIHKIIQKVNFKHSDFSESLLKIKSNDFIYLDPPYYPINTKSFVKYNRDGFNLENHKLLFKMCNELNKKNIKLIMSNSDVEFVKNSFTHSNYKIELINCKRRINSKKPGSTVFETIISNF